MKLLSREEKAFLSSLSTPQKIQDYLESIPFNHEEEGETCRSAHGVLVHKKAHCLEGAFLAATCLILQKRRPLILNLKVTEKDYDHILVLFKENGYWGAISKTNHAVLGYRDPIYKTVRELAMSYFHEYFLAKNGEKTLRGYSQPINLNRFGDAWIHEEDNLFSIAEAISDVSHSPIIPPGHEAHLRRATAFDRATISNSRDGN
jgi:hypothetical protein